MGKIRNRIFYYLEREQVAEERRRRVTIQTSTRANEISRGVQGSYVQGCIGFFARFQ